MKKAVIYYFSGTGNTALVAERIAKELKALGYAADTYRITLAWDSAPDPNAYDLVGLGYPIHAFNAPEIVCRFAKRLPEATRPIPAFIFKTSGEPFGLNRASSMTLIRHLRKKGYELINETHMLMPYNIMFRYKDAIAKHMYLHTMQMCRLAALKAASGRKEPVRCPLWALLWALCMRIEWVGARINGPLMHADKACTGCGSCVQHCPAGNITLHEARPRFSNRCLMCMACVMGCPENSIRPGLITPLRVNGHYDFQRLASDIKIPSNSIRRGMKGYFRLFCRYYERSNAQLRACGIAVPGEEIRS